MFSFTFIIKYYIPLALKKEKYLLKGTLETEMKLEGNNIIFRMSKQP